jgi:hypothetical protein
LHPLDDAQSFMKASPPPIPFDQPCLVALICLSPFALKLVTLLVGPSHLEGPFPLFHLHIQNVFPSHDVDALPDDGTLVRLMPPALDV